MYRPYLIDHDCLDHKYKGNNYTCHNCKVQTGIPVATSVGDSEGVGEGDDVGACWYKILDNDDNNSNNNNDVGSCW